MTLEWFVMTLEYLAIATMCRFWNGPYHHHLVVVVVVVDVGIPWLDQSRDDVSWLFRYRDPSTSLTWGSNCPLSTSGGGEGNTNHHHHRR